MSAGQGTATAFTDRVDPRAGSLSIGVTFGEALAGHQNNEAKAQSQAIDLGVIGTSLTGYDCGKSPTLQPSQLPQPLIVESGDPNASTGVSQSEEGGAFAKFAQADTTPFAKAVTTTAPFSIAGIISVGGGIATSYSGLVNGQRIAGATVDLSGVTFPGGTTLSALHWEAAYPSTSGAQPSGSFSIGHAVIAGVPVPSNDPSSTLATLNTVLNQIGLQLTPPMAHLVQGTMSVDPLEVSVVPNTTRDHIFGTVLSGIQPLSQAAIADLLQLYCQADTPVTVSQIAIGAISGAGSFNVELGGLSASSGAIAANSFVFGAPNFTAGFTSTSSQAGPAPVGGGTQLGPTAIAPTIQPASSGPSAPAPAQASTPTAPGAVVRTLPVNAIRGKGAGALAGVALSGLAALGVVAEGDRRMMRRAQRTVTFEE